MESLLEPDVPKSCSESVPDGIGGNLDDEPPRLRVGSDVLNREPERERMGKDGAPRQRSGFQYATRAHIEPQAFAALTAFVVPLKQVSVLSRYSNFRYATSRLRSPGIPAPKAPATYSSIRALLSTGTGPCSPATSTNSGTSAPVSRGTWF